jgi:phosphatidate cytidylyltransferase
MLKKTLMGMFFGIFLFLTLIFSNNAIIRPVFIGLMIAMTLLALKEFYHLTQAKNCKPNETLCLIFSFLFLICCTFFQSKLPCAITSFLFLLSLFIYYFFKGTSPIQNISASVFGFAYVTIPLSAILLIFTFFPESRENEGLFWLLFLFVIKVVTDSCAYYTGKLFGGKKMAPMISPNKTISGALGGFIFSLIAGVLLAYFFKEIRFVEGFFLAATLSILSQVGDLAESLLKRDAGVKDSHNLPGLGGILDATDSLIFAAPFLYLYLQYTYKG